MRQFADALSRLAKFATKAYRDGYMQSQVRGGIAYQILALRQKFGLSQTEFAQKTGKKQSVISRLESTEYGKASVQTLLDIASANDVALVVRFVSYPEFLLQTADMSVEAMQPDTIHESLEKKHYRLRQPSSLAPIPPVLEILSVQPQGAKTDWARVLEGPMHRETMGRNEQSAPALGQQSYHTRQVQLWN